MSSSSRTPVSDPANTSDAQAARYVHRIHQSFADRFTIVALELHEREFLKAAEGDVDPLKDHEEFFAFTSKKFDHAIEFGRIAFDSEEAGTIFDRDRRLQQRLSAILELFTLGPRPRTKDEFESRRGEILPQIKKVIAELQLSAVGKTG